MLHHLKTGKVERPFHVGFRAHVPFEQWKLKFFAEKVNVEGGMDPADAGVEVILKMAFYGFIAGYRKEGREVDFTVDDIESWIDEDMTLVFDIQRIWGESTPKEPEQGKTKPQKRGQKKP